PVRHHFVQVFLRVVDDLRPHAEDVGLLGRRDELPDRSVDRPLEREQELGPRGKAEHGLLDGLLVLARDRVDDHRRELHVGLVLRDGLELHLQRAVLQRESLGEPLPWHLEVQAFAHDARVAPEDGDDADRRLWDGSEEREQDPQPEDDEEQGNEWQRVHAVTPRRWTITPPECRMTRGPRCATTSRMSDAGGMAPDLPAAIGRYKIVSRLASDAIDAVYKGFDPMIERPVVVKVFRLRLGNPDAESGVKRTFFLEMQRTGALAHHGIATLYDAGEVPG